MKKMFLTSVFCFVVFISGYSQTKQESIKELFHTMQTDSLIDKSFTSMVPGILNQMQGQIKDSTARARSKEMMISVMQTAKEISKKMLNEDMVASYDKYFTQNEINDFIRFYKSPSGQKFIQVTPDIQKDMMTAMMQKYMPEIQKTIKAKIDESKKGDIK